MRKSIVTALALLLGLALISEAVAQGEVTKYVRYEHQGAVSYGILEGEVIQQLDGDLFASPKPTGKSVALADVRLLAPCVPSKVIAIGLNYKSHLGSAEPAKYPGLFAKYPTSIIGPGESIILPPDSKNAHYEGELVVVIGKRAKNVSKEDAPDYVFGVTCGNDVSERGWQFNDLQWWRAKAADTFGPIGPSIVRGLDYNNLQLETRLNGEVRQSQRTDDLLFDIATSISYISRYVTLEPGDLIFTGTPGSTKAMKPGDVVEIEIEGIGILSNPVVAAE